MNSTLQGGELPSRSQTLAPPDPFGSRARGVRVSSRALGWIGLNYERRDYRPSSRVLAHGSTEHLAFVSLTTGRIERESVGQRVEHQLSPGCVAVVPARTPVSWSWSTPISFAVLRLEPSFLERVAQSVFDLQPHDYRLGLAERRHDTAITNIAGVLAREVTRGQPGSQLYAESLASILAVHLLREYAEGGGRVLADGAALSRTAADRARGTRSGGVPRAVSAALAFIHQNYARELSLNDIAQAAHLSPFHLARQFKESLGLSPHRYLVELRVSNARALLSAGSGERSLAELAAAVGFADQSHLTRHFRRVTGLTPRQLRP